MTLYSIAGGCAAAFICGLIAGRYLRQVREGNAMALAIAVAAGLAVLQSTGWNDLMRVVQPRVALEWLPLVTILFAACSLIRTMKVRAACGIVLAVLTPVRLLWGSVYLQAELPRLEVLAGIAAWSAALALPLLLEQRESNAKPLSWDTVTWAGTWAVAVAGTAAMIVGSGSLTYGAATGICGLAILSVLMATSQIPDTGIVPLVCLIGISTSFAELPIVMAGLLLVVWVSILLADRLPSLRWAAVARVATVCTLLFGASLTYLRATSGASASSSAREQVVAGSGATTKALNEELQKLSSTTQREPAKRSSEPRQISDTAAEPAENQAAEIADPFAGFVDE